MLKLIDVSKSFGDIKALEDITFDIDEGEFVFITGPSGAGKTTILKLIIRELLPDRGEVIIDEKDITKLPQSKVPYLRQQLGFVFQDFKILPERTVRENIEVALAVTGTSQDEWNERIESVLDMVGLKERIDLFPAQLSGGEVQRVSIARALVVDPKIILADEPTGNIDWETADHLMEILKKINDEGKTVIMATHHEGIVDNMDERKIRLEKGRLVDDVGRKKVHKKKAEEEKKEDKEDKKEDKDDEKGKTEDKKDKKDKKEEKKEKDDDKDKKEDKKEEEKKEKEEKDEGGDEKDKKRPKMKVEEVEK